MARLNKESVLKYLAQDFLCFCKANNVPCENALVCRDDTCDWYEATLLHNQDTDSWKGVRISLDFGVVESLEDSSIDSWPYRDRWNKLKKEVGEKFINEAYLGEADFKFWERDAR